MDKLIDRIHSVGQRLTAAQPRELVVGNIVRRVLGLVREVAEDKTDPDGNSTANNDPDAGSPYHSPHDSLQRPPLSSSMSMFSPLKHGATLPMSHSMPDGTEIDRADAQKRPTMASLQMSYSTTAVPMTTSLFGLLSHPEMDSSESMRTSIGSLDGTAKSGPKTPSGSEFGSRKDDLKAEVLDGIRELLDELDQADDQIAAYALDNIHSNEIILTHTSSMTVQKFLLTAARKRKFTVVHVEAFPNDHDDTHTMILSGAKRTAGEELEADARFKPLTAAGITVILIPDSAVFAIMSRVNKVILATHSVLANGGLVAAAGARIIAKAANMHQTPVVVLSGVYKLSPLYPFDVEELIEHGDAGKVVGYENGDFVEGVDVVNPLFDYVPAELVDLYITNL